LLELINNARHFCKRIQTDIPMDQLLELEVAVAGREVSGTLNGRSLLRFTSRQSV